MKKPCSVCGDLFEAKRMTAKYCSGRCRVQAQRAATEPVTAQPALPAPAPASLPSPPAGGLAAVALAELKAVGRDQTAGGQLVLALARRIDQADDESGASLAALVKEFRATLTAAVAGAEQADDPIDELRKKRDSKNAAG